VFFALTLSCKKFGSIVCKELTGCDLSTIEGVRKFREENVVTLSGVP